MSSSATKSRITVVSATIDVADVNAAAFESPVYHNRAQWPVWCSAYFLGSVFTLFWFVMLTGILQSARPIDLAAPQELELIASSQPVAPTPTPVPPVKPRQSPPKSATPKTREPRPQPLVAPTTNDSSPLAPVVTEPPQETVSANTESAPVSSVETSAPAAPIKVEPLFRLTRLPDFGNAATLKYPVAEKNRGREGKVIAEFVIDEQGAVRDIKILKSAGTLFDQAVIDELSKITFTPPYIGERPVAARFRREFQFKLD